MSTVSRWNGSVIEIYDSAIQNIRDMRLTDYVCCYVTRMRVGTSVTYGFSNMVTELESIFGNSVHDNVPIELTVEFVTSYDVNKFLNACYNTLMAAKSLLNAKTSHIIFGNYRLENVLISQVSINMNAGTMGGTAIINVIGYEMVVLPNIPELKYYRSPIDTFENNYNSKCSIIIPGNSYVYELYLSGLDFNFQENIKTIGRNTEYTVYPRFPITSNITLTAFENPGQQGGGEIYDDNDEKPENNIENIYNAARNMINIEGVITIITAKIGTITYLPTGVSTDKTNAQQGLMGISGMVLNHTFDFYTPENAIEEVDDSISGS